MFTQQKQLIDQLQRFGWQVVTRETDNLEWWADEIWIIESSWSPQGQKFFLTFLVDPQWDGHRQKNQGVWAITASRQKPNSRQEAKGDPIISLKPKWEQRLPDFIAALSSLRDGLSNNSDKQTIFF